MQKRSALHMALLVPALITQWAMAQGATAVPEGAVIVNLGVEGGRYESLEVGESGGTLYLSAAGNPDSWNPLVAATTYAAAIGSFYLKPLIESYVTTGELYGELAESWDVSEDKLELTFHLRQGLAWSDGEPFTADDVVFTYNDLILNDDVDCRFRDLLRLPSGGFPDIAKVDAYTIRVTSPEVFRPLLNGFALPILPRHALARFVHKLNPSVAPGTFNGVWGIDTPPDDLVGLGPFLIQEYVADQSIKLRRNPRFYHYDQAGNQLPYVDEIVVRLVASGDLEMLQFINGEIDMLETQVRHLPALKLWEARKGFTVTLGQMEYGTFFLSLNQDTEDEQLRALFRQFWFRQAMAHAVDRERIVEVLHLGLGSSLWSPVSIPSPFYAGRERYGGPITERDAVVYEYDLVAAAHLLDQCGIHDLDGDGVREFADGTPVEFELDYGSSTTEQSGLIIAEDLLKIGVRANLRYLQFNHLVGKLFAGTAIEGVLIALAGGDDPHGNVSVFGSEGLLHFWHFSAAQGDRYDYEERIDELCNLAAGTYDLDEAFDYYKELQILFATEDLGLIFTAQKRFTCAIYDHIGNGQVCAEAGAVYGGGIAELVFIRPD